MLNILQYIPGYTYGGVETFVNNMNKELYKQCRFTYIIEKDMNNDIKKELLKYNSEIIKIPNMTKDGVWKHIKEVNKILKKGKYDIVHIHATDPRIFLTFFAKIYKIKKIIYHIHTLRSNKESIIRKIIRYLNIRLSNILMACSEQAAQSMFKKYARKTIIMNNGIDFKKYSFNKLDRQAIRKNLNITDNEILLGTVGRLEKVKNQIFLLKVMKRIVEKNSMIKLIIIGSGQEEEILKKFVRDNEIEKNIIFTGRVNDTSKLYSAMDLFCLPSLYEGFGIVLLEAQANGLMCLASNHIPKQTNIGGNVCFLGIDNQDIEKWAEKILKKTSCRDKNEYKVVLPKEYDIKNNAKTLLEIYKS